MNKDDYKHQLIALLPTGPMWPGMHTENNLTLLLDAYAKDFAAVDARVKSLLEEAFPNTCFELLPDWERNTGLPDVCTGVLETIQQRHNAIMGVLTIERSLSETFYVSLAARLGFEITITVLPNWEWLVTAPDDVNALYFRVGVSTVGEALKASDNNLLECVLNKVKPAHVSLTFNYI